MGETGKNQELNTEKERVPEFRDQQIAKSFLAGLKEVLTDIEETRQAETNERVNLDRKSNLAPFDVSNYRMLKRRIKETERHADNLPEELKQKATDMLFQAKLYLADYEGSQPK